MHSSWCRLCGRRRLALEGNVCMAAEWRAWMRWAAGWGDRGRGGRQLTSRGEAMKLGANSVLFGGYDMETAFKYLAMAGYDGIELSAIDDMSEHLVLDRWQSLAAEIKRLSRDYGLELLAMEQPTQDPARME